MQLWKKSSIYVKIRSKLILEFSWFSCRPSVWCRSDRKVPSMHRSDPIGEKLPPQISSQRDSNPTTNVHLHCTYARLFINVNIFKVHHTILTHHSKICSLHGPTCNIFIWQSEKETLYKLCAENNLSGRRWLPIKMLNIMWQYTLYFIRVAILRIICQGRGDSQSREQRG